VRKSNFSPKICGLSLAWAIIAKTNAKINVTDEQNNSNNKILQQKVGCKYIQPKQYCY
jgi:hypothetical protein